MSPMQSDREEYLTIIAPTASEAMAQFSARGLAAQGYAITGKIGRHQFSLVGGEESTELFAGSGMIAATFMRRVAE
ncbi:MAG TPA: hypothetical protein VL133_16725 [Devosia sp.]|nr:hypothetical protein [Devosia sp.]